MSILHNTPVGEFLPGYYNDTRRGLNNVRIRKTCRIHPQGYFRFEKIRSDGRVHKLLGLKDTIFCKQYEKQV